MDKTASVHVVNAIEHLHEKRHNEIKRKHCSLLPLDGRQVLAEQLHHNQRGARPDLIHDLLLIALVGGYLRVASSSCGRYGLLQSRHVAP